MQVTEIPIDSMMTICVSSGLQSMEFATSAKEVYSNVIYAEPIRQGDKMLRLLSEAFTNRRLFRGRLIEAPLTEDDKKDLTLLYATALGIDAKDAHYFFVEHLSTKSTYSEKDDSIDILYQDGSVKDIASASEILDLKSLTRKPKKLYLFQFRI